MRTDAHGATSPSRTSGAATSTRPDGSTTSPRTDNLPALGQSADSPSTPLPDDAATPSPHGSTAPPSSPDDAPQPSEALPTTPVPPIPTGALAPGTDVRVDTWLWATRQVKSRSQATAAARAGHVKVNGDAAKAAQKVRVGDEVRLRVEGFDRVLEVTQLLAKRVGAPQARLCYIDHSPERPRIVGVVPVRDRGAGRPSKKERRELDRLRGRDSHERS